MSLIRYLTRGSNLYLGLILVVIVGCGERKTDNGADDEASDPSVIGQTIFTSYCKACHGDDGAGITGIYPPLAGSDFLQDKERTIAAVVNGLQGEIVVKGEKYNAVMPPLPPTYSDKEAAAVLNYVINTFGNSSWQTSPEEISGIREK